MNKVPDVNWKRIKPNEQLVCEDVMPRDLRRLASEMVIQAFWDLYRVSVPIERKISAFLFLTDPDAFEMWADWAGTIYDDPYTILTRPRREIMKLLKARHA
jgi:hypothetical protein